MKKNLSNFNNFVPESIALDNGKEFKNVAIAKLLENMQLDMEIIPTTRPNRKGEVEAMFRKIELELRRCRSLANDLTAQQLVEVSLKNMEDKK